MKKISFDFDQTLDNEHIQNYAIELMNMNYEIHIVTSRPDKWENKWKIKGLPEVIWDNDDLYEVADRIRIKRENIHFTEYTPKYKFFEKNEDFIFHIDDDHIEIDEINNKTKTKAILFEQNWKENCNEKLRTVKA